MAGVAAQPAIEWDKIYEGNLIRSSTVLPTNDGGSIVGRSEISDGSNYWITKYNAAGKKVWDKVFAGNKRDNVTAISQKTDEVTCSAALPQFQDAPPEPNHMHQIPLPETVSSSGALLFMSNKHLPCFPTCRRAAPCL